MAKRRYEVTERKIAAWLKEGRGTGAGADYKPWLRVYDVPNVTTSSRIKSWIHGRPYQALAWGEQKLVLAVDWSERYVDAREQFPLPREATREIAYQLGVKHPNDHKTGVDIVMTTDLMLFTANQGDTGETRHPCTVKPASDLENPRIIEKLEIERRFYAQLGESLTLFTEEELLDAFADNLTLVHEKREFTDLVGESAKQHGSAEQLAYRLSNELLASASNLQLNEFCHLFDQRVSLPKGTALNLAYSLVARRQLVMDMYGKELYRQPVLSIQGGRPFKHRGEPGQVAA